jgi:uncharacterized protein (TIGR02145 family)
MRQKIHRKGVAGYAPTAAAGILLALVFTFTACGGSKTGVGDEIYKTVVIGTQTWMAKNLNYNAEGSVCYDNDPANCEKYGRLYNWATAMALPSDCNTTSCSEQIGTKHQGICPSGWHLPSNAEWDILVRYVDGISEDKFGFSALLGGYGGSSGSFSKVGSYGSWWSTFEYDSAYSYHQIMDYNGTYSDYYAYDKSHLFSVRCVKD